MKFSRIFRMGAVLLAVVLGGMQTVSSQSGPITDVPGEALWCVNSNSCFNTLVEAENALRASIPDIGQFLKVKYWDLDRIYYYVPDQPPSSYQTPWYGGWNYSNYSPCPNSPAPPVYNAYAVRPCYSESEVIQNTIEYLKSRYCDGIGNCVRKDFAVEGNYEIPFSSVYGSRFSSLGKQITFTTVYNGQENRISNGQFQIFREIPFVCPKGTQAIETKDKAVYPNVCRSTAGGAVYKKKHQLVQSCPANRNPCYPATGDKFRAETDFIFAGRQFTRYYHSLRESNIQESMLGLGWTHSFAERALPYSSLYFSSEGYQYSSQFTGSNKFVVPALGSMGEDLATPSGRQIRVVESDGEIRVFSLYGQLISITDPNNPERDVRFVFDSPFNSSPKLVQAIDHAGRILQFHYNAQNRVSDVILPDGRKIGYGYDQDNLVSVDYGNGQIKRYVYSEPALAPNGDKGLLTGIISEDGQRYASFGYDMYGRVKSSVLQSASSAVDTTYVRYTAVDRAEVDTADGQVRKYIYRNDSYRKPLFVTDLSGTTASTYDSYQRLLTNTDGRGVQTSYTYNTTWQLSQQVEAANATGNKRTTQTDWHATLNAPIERRVLDANNVLVAKETWTYNARGQVLTHAFVDPTTNAARTTTTTYCEDANACGGVGLVTSIDGPRTDANDVTIYSYYLSDDSTCATTPQGACAHRKGDLWTVTNALGQVTETLAYDGAGRVLSVKDPNGVITDYTYTARGWLASKTVRGGGVEADRQTRIEYWPTGLVSFVYQPDNSFTAFTYDAAHRLTDVYDNAGNKIHYTLDNAGNRTKEDTSDPNGTLTRTLSRVYNQLGQLQQSLTANNHATTYAYDPNGNTTGVSDALGHATGNAYDPLGRLVQTLQDTSGINAGTQFAYDANDRLTKVTDPKGLATNYSYNGLGDLTQLTSPDTGATGYTYDAAGNRLSQTDARDITANYAYDALNRLVAISYPDPAYNQSYTYDALQAVCPAGEQTVKGLLTGMQAKGATTQYCYDRWGQLVRKVQTVGNLAQVTRYAYDAYGRLQGLTYPDGGAVDYVRNSLGQITEVGYTPANGSRSVVVTGTTYAPFGPATGWNYGNGRHLDRTLTLDYRPNAIQDGQAGGLSYAYGFDAVGNLGALKDGTQTTDLGKFVYDGLNRLTQQQNGLGSPLYTWNYDATGNRAQAQGITGGTQAYAYGSGSHHLVQVGAATRSYDAVGNTTDMGNGKGYSYGPDNRMGTVQIAGVSAMQYGYDAKGQQISRTNGGASSVFAYDEAGHWLGEYDGTGTVKQQVIWLDDMPVGVVTTASNVPVLAYVEPDHLGTPRAIIDATRNVAVWSWPLTSEAFGNMQPDQDPDGDGVLFAFDLRFPGQRYDSATGLNYNYFRDYEPAVGRYFESDPIGLNGGLSTMGYAGQRPLNLFDPLGLESGMFQFGQYKMPPPTGLKPGDFNDAVTAFKILSALDAEMKARNIVGSDQFYHCLGGCRATQATRNSAVVLELMALKEDKDYYAGRIGLYGDGKRRSHSVMREDNNADMAVNRFGASCSMGEDCSRRCMNLVPERARKFLSNYIPEWRER